METNVISIGNSKGVIIPAKLMRVLGLGNKVNMRVENGNLVIARTEKKARQGWEEMILGEIEKRGPSEKLMPDFFEDELTDEWQW